MARKIKKSFKLSGSPFKRTESVGQAVTDKNELVNVNRDINEVTNRRNSYKQAWDQDQEGIRSNSGAGKGYDAMATKLGIPADDPMRAYKAYVMDREGQREYDPTAFEQDLVDKTGLGSEYSGKGDVKTTNTSYSYQHIPSSTEGTKGDMVDGFNVGDVRSQMVTSRRISNYDNKFNRKITNTQNKLDRLSGENKNKKLQGKLNKMLDGYTPDQIKNMGEKQIDDGSGNMIDNPDYNPGKFAAYNKKMESNRYKRISSNLAENQRMQSLNTDKSKREQNLENKLSNLQTQQQNIQTTQGFHTDSVNQGRNINLYNRDELKNLVEAGGVANTATQGSSSNTTVLTDQEIQDQGLRNLSDVTNDAGTNVSVQGNNENNNNQNNDQNNNQNNDQNDQDSVNDQNQGGGNNDERGQNQVEVDSTSVNNNFQPNKLPNLVALPPNQQQDNTKVVNNKQTAFENLLANMSEGGLEGAPSVNSFGGPKMRFGRSGVPYKQKNK